jgi:prolyl oligopeptidase
MRTYGADGTTADAVLLGTGLNPEVDIAADAAAIDVSPRSPFAIGIVSQGVQSELSLYVAPLTQLRGAATPWRKLAVPEHGITDFALRGEWIYLLTHDHASRYRILRWSLKDPRPFAPADAETVVPESTQVLRSLAVAKDALYVQAIEAGSGRLLRLEYNVKIARASEPAARARSRKGPRKTATSLPKSAGIARGAAVRLPIRGAIDELDADPLRAGALVRLSGWTVPPGYFAIDGKTGAVIRTDLLRPAGADWGEITSTETTVKSHDGTDVPVSLVYPKSVARDGSAPLLIEAYGAYGVTRNRHSGRRCWPGSSAVASMRWHVRGGGELGYDWHRGGFENQGEFLARRERRGAVADRAALDRGAPVRLGWKPACRLRLRATGVAARSEPTVGSRRHHRARTGSQLRRPSTQSQRTRAGHEQGRPLPGLR